MSGMNPSTSNPKISVGLPVYNGANFLERAIRSILDSDYQDLELIISDNGSTDATESICQAAAAVDSRVRYYRNAENLGASRNYNRTFELARGQYFKWHAHDDECHPAMLRRCIEALETSPQSVVMVYPLGELIDEDGNTITSILDRMALSDPRPHKRLAHLLRTLNMCDGVFGVYKTTYLERTGLIGPFVGADYVLLGELAMLGEIAELDEVLFRLRAHDLRSMQANPTTRDKTAWYDPKAAKRKVVLPNWEQMVWALLQATWRAPLPLGDKLLCLATVPTVHYWRRFKTWGGLVKRRLKARVARFKASSQLDARHS